MSFINLAINPPVFAHRGASAYAPENTIAAFLKAKQLGIHWLEFDVTLSADHQVVVIHDDTLDRTTDGSGYVCDYTYEHLLRLDAGSWYSEDFAGENLPLLDDVLRFMQMHNMAANIEIKSLPGKENIIATKVLELTQHQPLELIISSFSPQILYAVRHLDSHTKLGLLMHEWNPEWKRIAHQLECVSIHVNQAILNPEMVNELKNGVGSVFSYTVNDVKRATELFSWGVDAVYSDCPDRIC